MNYLTNDSVSLKYTCCKHNKENSQLSKIKKNMGRTYKIHKTKASKPENSKYINSYKEDTNKR